MRTTPFLLSSLTAVLLTTAANAGDYSQYPAPERHPFRRSHLTGDAVLIPPYRRPFPVRVYTTTPQQPYYNVPPYEVIAPY